MRILFKFIIVVDIIIIIIVDVIKFDIVVVVGIVSRRILYKLNLIVGRQELRRHLDDDIMT